MKLTAAQRRIRAIARKILLGKITPAQGKRAALEVAS